MAAAAALAVVLPQACGLGGDALFLVRREGEQVAFNGNGAAPAALDGAIPADGGATAAVPGAVAALADVHARFGVLSLAEALAPARELAEHGFAPGEALAAAIARQRRRLERGAAGWGLLDVTWGDATRQPALARLVEAIGGDGPRAFHTGAIADAMARRCAVDAAAWRLRTSPITPPSSASPFGPASRAAR